MNCWIDCKNGSKRVATQQLPRSAFLLSSSVVKAITAVGSGTAAKPRRCFFCSGVKTASKLSSAVFSRPPGSLIKETGQLFTFRQSLVLSGGHLTWYWSPLSSKSCPDSYYILCSDFLKEPFEVCGLGASLPRCLTRLTSARALLII